MRSPLNRPENSRVTHQRPHTWLCRVIIAIVTAPSEADVSDGVDVIPTTRFRAASVRWVGSGDSTTAGGVVESPLQTIGDSTRAAIQL